MQDVATNYVFFVHVFHVYLMCFIQRVFLCAFDAFLHSMFRAFFFF